jgi:hypothetical protein
MQKTGKKLEFANSVFLPFSSVYYIISFPFSGVILLLRPLLMLFCRSKHQTSLFLKSIRHKVNVKIKANYAMKIDKIMIPPEKLAAAINKHLIPALMKKTPEYYENRGLQKREGKSSAIQRDLRAGEPACDDHMDERDAKGRPGSG